MKGGWIDEQMEGCVVRESHTFRQGGARRTRWSSCGRSDESGGYLRSSRIVQAGVSAQRRSTKRRQAVVPVLSQVAQLLHPVRGRQRAYRERQRRCRSERLLLFVPSSRSQGVPVVYYLSAGFLREVLQPRSVDRSTVPTRSDQEKTGVTGDSLDTYHCDARIDAQRKGVGYGIHRQDIRQQEGSRRQAEPSQRHDECGRGSGYRRQGQGCSRRVVQGHHGSSQELTRYICGAGSSRGLCVPLIGACVSPRLPAPHLSYGGWPSALSIP